MTNEYCEENKYLEMDIKNNTVPCWYELSLGPTDEIKHLYIKIHEDFLAKQGKLNPFLIGKLEKNFMLPEFKVDFKNDVGFGGIFKNLGQDKDGMFVYQAEIPKAVKESNKTCQICHGRRKSSCDICYNTGKEVCFDYQSAYQLSASITVLMDILAFPKDKTSSRLPQLLKLETKTEHGEHGGSLWGKIGLDFNNFIKQLNTSEINRICTPAMVKTYQKMLFSAPFLERRFRSGISDYGTLFLDCIGDRSGIFSDEYYRKTDKGYEFSCHNIDDPTQQISIIAGLAALHDVARKPHLNKII